MDFASLGMFILDDIYYPIPRTPATNIIGGAGSWAILGARIVKGTGRGLGWTVHTGSDFPEESRKEIESWSTECNFVNTPYRVTTRGLNVYRQHERRGKANLMALCFSVLLCRMFTRLSQAFVLKASYSKDRD